MGSPLHRRKTMMCHKTQLETPNRKVSPGTLQFGNEYSRLPENFYARLMADSAVRFKKKVCVVGLRAAQVVARRVHARTAAIFNSENSPR